VDSIFSTGVQLLGKVRENAYAFIQKCKSELFERELDNYEDLLDDPEFSYELDSIADQYQQVAGVLREKKDRLGLLEALKAQGELILLFGDIKRAQSIWKDSIDGLFNTLDTCENWESILPEAVRRLEYFTVYGALPIISVLGNLSKYCSTNDWDMKSRCARMAAVLVKVPFAGSVGFPLLPHGFAAFVCRDLGGTAPLYCSSDQLSIQGLCDSIQEILKVLESQEFALEALPFVVLLEHIYACYTRKSNSWLQVRLIRVRLLIKIRMFAEAVAMLADIKVSILAIERGVYDDVLSQLLLVDRGETSATFDIGNNGLNLYKAVAYMNNEPPDSQSNKASIEWIFNYSAQLQTFLGEFYVDLPNDALDPVSDEEKKAQEEAAALAAAAGMCTTFFFLFFEYTT
jgi:hypothetical protein